MMKTQPLILMLYNQSTETIFSHVSKTRPRNQRLNYLRVAPFYGTFKGEAEVLSSPEDL